MKTPQRNFVVEFKSPRRQKARTDSIWGDTDLKALAREVETQSPEFANSEKTQDTVSPAVDILPDPIDLAWMGVSIPRVGGIHVAELRAGSPEAVEPAQVDVDRADAVTVASVQEGQHLRQPRKSSARTSRKRTDRKDFSIKEDKDREARSATSTDPVSLGEIAELELENKRLKALLAEHLRDQNIKLKLMLVRFDITG